PATGYDPLPVTFTINNATGKSITKLAVDYNGNGVIDETFTDAVTFNHTYVDGGQFNAVAYVTDSAGTTYLASTAISVQRHADQPLLSDLSFVSPLNQAMIAGDTILVQGRYAGPDQATITLNGQPVLRYQDRWYVNNVHLLPGANTLTARAVSDDGQTAETIITVTSTAVSPVTVAIDHESGLIPLTVNLSINNPGNLPLNHVSVDFDGDGTFEIDTSDLSMPLTHTFDQPGDAVMTVTVSDGNGGVYVAKVAVVAEQSGEQLDTAFRALYNGMLAALAQGDIDGATSFIDGDERPYYRQLFLDLATTNDLAVLATQLGTLESGVIGDGWAEYIIGREENGMQKGFGIHFVRESDGTWEIGGF
ncbi:MAG TPA: hypothetical protein DIC36_05825, partial [Gammaproteobacteria bacterium]|nr:hypothetical protein [Gammaproteobacteria bacterium]